MLGHICNGLKYACYLLYPILLAIFAWNCMRQDASQGAAAQEFLRALVIPAAGFILVSVLRRVIAEPRPYEACGIEQLIAKSTHGKSFPSRHVYSIAVIGMCWLRYMPPVGAIILLASLVMAGARVLGGVHYPRDVACGFALGVLTGLAMWV